jgi:ATP-dependent protease ClpP protease subunit
MKKLAILVLILLLPHLSQANSKQVLRLNENNTVLLNKQVDTDSVKDVINQLRLLDKLLPPEAPIFLVLNTPGGSVLDGMDIVNVAQSLERPVHTLTIFAASMGFVLAQHLNKRFILQNGVLMSHRMKSGTQGEVGGEMDEMLRFSHIINTIINQGCADRMHMSLSDYNSRVADEWWLFGQNAVDLKAADEVVTFSCSEQLISNGKCPL